MKKKILDLCRSKGFFIDKDMLVFLSDLEDGCGIIEKMISFGFNERIITCKVFDKYNKEFNLLNIYLNKNEDVKILSSKDFSSRKVCVNDFVQYFKVRYEKIRDILVEKNFNDLTSIRRIGFSNGIYSVIGMVYSKRITKNKNLLIEIEDLTGRSVVLVNCENKNLFNLANNLLLDDIVVFKVSGSEKMLFANDIIFPDIKLEKEKFGDIDEFIAFGGDFHVGSRMFLEKNVLKFVNWLNGKVGDERQRSLARKVKYLILTGDNIEGVGVYPGQEKFLSIKSCRNQYRKLEEILRKIRSDVQIVMCPGQHDAVWLGEPQPSISEKWLQGLYNMKNLHLVSNPGLVEISGFKILMYYGLSIGKIKDFISNGKSLKTNDIVKEVLKRRHLASSYGLMDVVVDRDIDRMVVDVVPDIVAVGNRHRAEVDSYNNILIVAGSCWQSITSFEESVGSVPDPCKVPLFNLKSREIKIIDFGDDEIKWEDGDDLVCKLGVKNENCD